MGEKCQFSGIPKESKALLDKGVIKICIDAKRQGNSIIGMKTIRILVLITLH